MGRRDTAPAAEDSDALDCEASWQPPMDQEGFATMSIHTTENRKTVPQRRSSPFIPNQTEDEAETESNLHVFECGRWQANIFSAFAVFPPL